MFVRSELYYLLRIVIALLCGFFIGFERNKRLKDAGIRTHCLVACASALVIIISKYGFTDIPDISGVKEADPSRIASQIVSGIGFLGAGMIFVHKSSIKGLTTASGIWATAGIGMAIGAGMFTLGIGTTVIILIVQILLHCNFKFLHKPEHKHLKLYHVTDKKYLSEIMDLLALNNVIVLENRVHKDIDNDEYTMDFIIETIPKSNLNSLFTSIKYDYIVSNDV